jgi:hypothetical protein
VRDDEGRRLLTQQGGPFCAAYPEVFENLRQMTRSEQAFAGRALPARRSAKAQYRCHLPETNLPDILADERRALSDRVFRLNR